MHINSRQLPEQKTKLTEFSKELGGVKKLSMLVCSAIFLTSSFSFAWQQEAQQSTTSAYECTQVALDDVDSGLLTKQERIALLDNSLSESIDSYSSCVSSVTQNMSGGGSGQGSEALDNGQGQLQSTNSQQLGDELEMEGGQPGNTSKEQDTLPEEMPETSPVPIKGTGSTSAPRGIIPPKDNDKIICKLLFQEINKTQDPDMIKGLTQQYSNYKCG
jgi:hypothetical protein